MDLRDILDQVSVNRGDPSYDDGKIHYQSESDAGRVVLFDGYLLAALFQSLKVAEKGFLGILQRPLIGSAPRMAAP